jgi:hypothetical protein
MTPAQSALVDQTEAAARHGLAAFIEAAGRLDHPTIGATIPTGAHLDLLTRLHTQIGARHTTSCPHLNVRHPQPIYWIAWRPGRLRCAPCATTAGATIKNTAEERRCDSCRTIAPTIHAGGLQIPAVVAPQLLIAAGPLTILFGLCGACQATTRVSGGQSLPPQPKPRGSRGRSRGRGRR